MALNQIGAGWQRTSAKGTKFISIVMKIGGRDVNLLVFKNTRKQNPKAPDYTVHIVQDQAAAPARAKASVPPSVPPRKETAPGYVSPANREVPSQDTQSSGFDKFYEEPAGDGPSEDDLPF